MIVLIGTRRAGTTPALRKLKGDILLTDLKKFVTVLIYHRRGNFFNMGRFSNRPTG
jgi:hypothetical protein